MSDHEPLTPIARASLNHESLTPLRRARGIFGERPAPRGQMRALARGQATRKRPNVALVPISRVLQPWQAWIDARSRSDIATERGQGAATGSTLARSSRGDPGAGKGDVGRNGRIARRPVNEGIPDAARRTA